jgi:beta-glucosidase
MKIKCSLFVFFLPVACGLMAQSVSTRLSSKTDEIISSLTIHEKVSLLVGIGQNTYRNPPTGSKTVLAPGAAGYTSAVPRLGLTPVSMADGPSGVRLYPGADDYKETFCTAFPSAISIGASWDTEVAETIGKATGEEAREYGIDVLLAPGMNLQRNPLCGRNFEYYSEDPLITGKMAAAYTNGVQSNGIGATLKVAFAYNQETLRREYNAIISQRAIREIYLRSFEIAIGESNPWAIMTSYNLVNGLLTSENPDLLKIVLRSEYGFNGVFMTDWLTFGNGAAKVRAGCNLLMWGTPHETAEIYEGLKNKTISEAMVDEAVRPVIELILKSKRYQGFQPSKDLQLENHKIIARETAASTMVLLKNKEYTLPFKKIKTIALFGKTSYDFIPNGKGSAEVYYKHAVSFEEGLANAGYKTESKLSGYYRTKLDSIKKESLNKPQGKENLKFAIADANELSVSREHIKNSLPQSDIALITIGRISSEGSDMKEEGYYQLSETEMKLITDVCEIYHQAGKKIIVVLNIGTIIDVAHWKDKPDAILVAWQTGIEGGNALCDILSGKVTPSGKLSSTFPMKYADVPSSKVFPLEKGTKDSHYGEGIYVGYRYYDTYNIPVAYEFGYGLSYTNFTYSNLLLSSKIISDTLKVRCKITNTGKYEGKEVVQLYLSAPKKSIDKPIHELKGFVKTKLLKPGESQEVEFTIVPKHLSSFWSGNSAWIMDEGSYEVQIGASSRDIRLRNVFNVNNMTEVEKVNNMLFPNIHPKTEIKSVNGNNEYDTYLNLK